jgi:hypothetical protein
VGSDSGKAQIPGCVKQTKSQKHSDKRRPGEEVALEGPLGVEKQDLTLPFRPPETICLTSPAFSLPASEGHFQAMFSTCVGICTACQEIYSRTW